MRAWGSSAEKWMMRCLSFVGIRVDALRFFFFQAEDGIRDGTVTGVQTCALPIFRAGRAARDSASRPSLPLERYSGHYRDELYGDADLALEGGKLVLRFSRSPAFVGDRKSTRLNSSHSSISYAVFCLKKKTDNKSH